MPLSFMRRPQATLDIQIERDAFSQGDTIEARVSISTNKGFQVRRGVITLVCVETYWERETHYNTGTRTTSTRLRARTRRLMEFPVQFMNDVEIRNGLPFRDEFKFELPEDAPPTVFGKVASIQWQIDVSLDVQGARDLHEERQLTVKASDSGSGNETPSPVLIEEDFGECRLRLELPSDAGTLGGSVSGRLRLDALKDCDFSEVRVEMVSEEQAGDKSDGTVQNEFLLESGVSLSANRSQEWRFTLNVPEGPMPTTHISETHLRWSVKAVFARSRRRDYSVENEIVIDWPAV